MQLIFLPVGWSIALCLVLWGCFHMASVWVGIKLPKRLFSSDAWIFRSRPWEQGGEVYRTIFHVHKWKHLLPDGGAVFKHGYRKKQMDDFSSKNLEMFLSESRRAELSHWIAIFPFWIFGFLAPFYVIFIMFAYAVLINMPCVVAQRYNRPRIEHILEKRRQLKNADKKNARRQ